MEDNGNLLRYLKVKTVDQWPSSGFFYNFMTRKEDDCWDDLNCFMCTPLLIHGGAR
jgi:hypothetical protein